MEIFDISRALSEGLAPWPGDTPFQYKLKSQIAEGATVNIGAIGMSVHNGTHADAPFHFASDGVPIDALRLETYVGPAVVADLAGNYRSDAMPQIRIGDLSEWSDELKTAPRLLLKTNVWLDSRVFPTRIPTIAPDVPAWWQERGVKLLGFDVPSVDEITAKNLVNHHALAAAGINIIESLDLRSVSAGCYNVSALPVKIAGADGAPVRAVLWRD
ncbi:MAG: cyclase family protein [Chthoniobacterales bacterium]